MGLVNVTNINNKLFFDIHLYMFNLHSFDSSVTKS